MHDQVETAFAHVETERNALISEKEEREAELEAANADIAAQAKRIYELEEALDATQSAETEARQEREVEMQVVAALKEVLEFLNLLFWDINISDYRNWPTPRTSSVLCKTPTWSSRLNWLNCERANKVWRDETI